MAKIRIAGEQMISLTLGVAIGIAFSETAKNIKEKVELKINRINVNIYLNFEAKY
jgi:hypothetical protein